MPVYLRNHLFLDARVHSILSNLSVKLTKDMTDFLTNDLAKGDYSEAFLTDSGVNLEVFLINVEVIKTLIRSIQLTAVTLREGLNDARRKIAEREDENDDHPQTCASPEEYDYVKVKASDDMDLSK